jgi:hypothetical protein
MDSGFSALVGVTIMIINCRDKPNRYVEVYPSLKNKHTLFLDITDEDDDDGSGYMDITLNREDVKKLISNLILFELRMSDER